jgi:hypothetical protein
MCIVVNPLRDTDMNEKLPLCDVVHLTFSFSKSVPPFCKPLELPLLAPLPLSQWWDES